jgi:hypothetical protein
MDLPRRCVAFGFEPAESCAEQRAHSAHADGGGNYRAHAIRQEDAVAQLPASHGSWVPRSGCKCVGSGTWHVQPESFTCAGRVRIARYCACLRFGVQGTGVGSVEVIPRPTCTTVYMCTTLGLYLQRRDTRKYAQMYTDKFLRRPGAATTPRTTGAWEGAFPPHLRFGRRSGLRVGLARE